MQGVVLVQILDLESLGEVVTKEMRGAALQGARILHHAFDAGGHHRAREFFRFALDAFDDRHRGLVDREIRILVEDAIGLFHGFLVGGMRSVTFLPIELGGAQEKFGA